MADFGMNSLAISGGRAGGDAYSRLFGTPTGTQAAQTIGNESRTLDVLSSFSLEVLLDYLEERWGFTMGPAGFGRRYLAVGGSPADSPTLLVLDPTLADVSQSRRLTDEIDLDPQGLIAAFERLRPSIGKIDSRLEGLFSQNNAQLAVEILLISQPEIVLSRRPRMEPLCAPSPYIPVSSGLELSTAGVFCRDANGDLGVTACFHGTGPIGTQVSVGGVPALVKLADPVQDVVFIPLGPAYVIPNTCGRAGIRTSRAPSEAEPVAFEGAGSQARITTWVKSHDAGILRKRPTVQLKLQTPHNTNSGDSGSALIDEDDRIVGFGFERTGLGEFPEFTDWIWADNALSALGLTPI
jgi:hypothetical protein